MTIRSLSVVTVNGTGHDIVAGIVRHYGGTLTTIRERRDAYNARMDRLILLGGADISPFLYGEPVVDARPSSGDRDGIEWILARRAITEQVPTLGICRGHQMLAVAHGGTLYQDIFSFTGNDHPSMYDHELTVKTTLRRHIPTNRVNSLHHQAVRVVPAGFEVLARSKEDGIIESIYRPGYLGVQFHPELMYPSDKRWLKLFDWWYAGELA